MSEATCATHPGAAAPFRCDGCGEFLCADCVSEGHRLLFCRLCGERALPVAPAEAATAPGRRAATRRATAATYRFADALTYPLRGTGGYAFWSVLALLGLLALAQLVPVLGIFAGAAGTIFGIAVLFLLPRFLFAIAATTAQGEDELPDWPDFDVWDLVAGAAHFVVIAVLCLLPAWALLEVAGCGLGDLLVGRASGGRCLAALVPGFVLAVALWVPAFGAGAVYHSPWLFFRLDLHVKAVAAAPAEWAQAVALLAGLFVAGLVLPALLAWLPLVGSLAGTAVQLYTLFLGAHLAGVWFRRHPAAMERIYLG
jgi:hypothetical protein